MRLSPSYFMTLDKIVERLRIGVDRDDLDSLYEDITNQALHDVQVRRNWSCMKQLDVLTMASGTKTVDFPSDFKCLTTERSPICSISSTVITPCVIYSREKLDRLVRNFGAFVSATTKDRLLSVYVDAQDDQWFMGISENATEDLTFSISYFGFLPDLITGGGPGTVDSNSLSENYPEMIINRAKFIAFKLVNDPEWKDAEAAYQIEFQDAVRTDAAIALAAHPKHM